MGKPTRHRMEPTERWEQLELLFTSPEQRIYEQIRPVVLFGILLTNEPKKLALLNERSIVRCSDSPHMACAVCLPLTQPHQAHMCQIQSVKRLSPCGRSMQG